MSEFPTWSQAYEEFLLRRHDLLVDIARIRSRALRAAKLSTAAALLTGAVAVFYVDGTWQLVLAGLSGINAGFAALHRLLVARIDRDIRNVDLTIEFQYALDDLQR